MALSAPFSFKPGQWDVLQVSDGVLWHKWWSQAFGWANESVAQSAGVAVSLPDQEPRVTVGPDGMVRVVVEDAAQKVWWFQQAADASTWTVAELP